MDDSGWLCTLCAGNTVLTFRRRRAAHSVTKCIMHDERHIVMQHNEKPPSSSALHNFLRENHFISNIIIINKKQNAGNTHIFCCCVLRVSVCCVRWCSARIVKCNAWYARVPRHTHPLPMCVCVRLCHTIKCECMSLSMLYGGATELFCTWNLIKIHF